MIAGVWDSLKASPAQGQGVLTRRVTRSAPVVVYAAVTKPGNTPMLWLTSPTPAMPRDFRSPEALGFKTSVRPETSGPQGTVRVELELLEEAGESAFRAMVDDILARVEPTESPKAAMREFFACLGRWHSFFRAHGFSGLSPQAQKGLYGELFFLREMLAPISSASLALRAWVGPSGANQDFEYAGHAFEVKTTSANPLVELRIANIRQLDDSCVDSLHLVVIEVECHQNADHTLPQAVEETKRLVLENAPQAAFELADKLIEYGYVDQHADHYTGTGYSVRAVHAFEVAEGFPRLTEDDVPAGVGDVRYSVALSAIGDFELRGDGFSDIAKEWFSELGV